MTATVAITRAVLDPLVLDPGPTSDWRITEDGLGRPDRAWVTNYASSRDWHGAIATDARLEHTSLSLTVDVYGTSSVNVENHVTALVNAVSQFAYTVNVTVDGVTQSWAADPADVTFGGYDSGDVAQFIRTVSLTIPVYPIPS